MKSRRRFTAEFKAKVALRCSCWQRGGRPCAVRKAIAKRAPPGGSRDHSYFAFCPSHALGRRRRELRTQCR